MPTYTYACASCGAEIERRQSFSDARLSTCETCGSALRRVVHPVGVIFKGSGFYNTDYKKSTGSANGDGAAEKPKDGAKSGEAKESAKSSEGDSPSSSSKSESGARSDSGSGKSDSGSGKGDSSGGKGDSGSTSSTAATKV